MSLFKFLMVSAFVTAGAPAYSASDQEVRVANEGGISEWWSLADDVAIVAPGYPQSAMAQKHDACLAMGYLIKPDGTTSDHVVVKRWSDAPADAPAWDAFGRAASLALSQWRFSPKPGTVARPTFTVATFVFSGAGATAPASSLGANCKVEDLLTAVVGARHEAFERGSINREWLDKAYRETMRREIRANQANRCRLSHSMAEHCLD